MGEKPKNIENIEVRNIKARAVSPNYFVTQLNEDKFTEGVIIDKKAIFGRTFEQNLDGKIRVYEDRVKGWFLDHARKLLDGGHHADFIVLMICTSYLEGNQQFKEGKRSKVGEIQNVIKRALKEIFVISEDKNKLLDIFVDAVRNGLFHDGMTRERVSISRDFNEPISFSLEFGGMININPVLFLWIIEEDFKRYTSNLKNPQNTMLRDNFEKHWSERQKIK